MSIFFLVFFFKGLQFLLVLFLLVRVVLNLDLHFLTILIIYLKIVLVRSKDSLQLILNISNISENIDHIYLLRFLLLKWLQDLANEIFQGIDDFLIENVKVLEGCLVVFDEGCDSIKEVVYLVTIITVFEGG